MTFFKYIARYNFFERLMFIIWTIEIEYNIYLYIHINAYITLPIICNNLRFIYIDKYTKNKQSRHFGWKKSELLRYSFSVQESLHGICLYISCYSIDFLQILSNFAVTCSLNRVQVFTIFAGLQVYEEYTVRNKSEMATIILNGNNNLR